MKKLIFTIIILLVSLTSQAQKVDCETDEFTGDTTCQSEFINLETGQSDTNILAVKFAYILDSNQYAMVVGHVSNEWQWLNESNVYFLIDGNRYTLDLVNNSSDILDNGNVVEDKIVLLNKSLVDKINNASSVKFKISNDVGVLNYNAKNALSELLLNVKNL